MPNIKLMKSYAKEVCQNAHLLQRTYVFLVFEYKLIVTSINLNTFVFVNVSSKDIL